VEDILIIIFISLFYWKSLWIKNHSRRRREYHHWCQSNFGNKLCSSTWKKVHKSIGKFYLNCITMNIIYIFLNNFFRNIYIYWLCIFYIIALKNFNYLMFYQIWLIPSGFTNRSKTLWFHILWHLESIWLLIYNQMYNICKIMTI